MVRSGGLLVIDHRNYDHILSTGCAPPGKNIYYKVGSLGEGGPRVGGVILGWGPTVDTEVKQPVSPPTE